MFSHKRGTYVVASMPDVLLTPYGLQQVIASDYELRMKEERAARSVKSNPRKRKNFHHNPNDEIAIREVLLSVQNDHGFYEMVLKPAAKNMAIKQYKGRFNKTLALKMYKHVADRADKFYAWTYGDRTKGTRYWMAQKGFMLTPADRKQLAAELL